MLVLSLLSTLIASSYSLSYSLQCENSHVFLNSNSRSYSDAAATNNGVGEDKSESRGKGKDKPNCVGCAVVGVETWWVFPVARFHGKINGFS